MAKAQSSERDTFWLDVAIGATFGCLAVVVCAIWFIAVMGFSQ